MHVLMLDVLQIVLLALVFFTLLPVTITVAVIAFVSGTALAGAAGMHYKAGGKAVVLFCWLVGVLGLIAAAAGYMYLWFAVGRWLLSEG